MVADFIVVLCGLFVASLMPARVFERHFLAQQQLRRIFSCVLGVVIILLWWFRIKEIWGGLILLALLAIVLACFVDRFFNSLLAAYVINVLSNISLIVRDVAPFSLTFFKCGVYLGAILLMVKFYGNRRKAKKPV